MLVDPLPAGAKLVVSYCCSSVIVRLMILLEGGLRCP